MASEIRAATFRLGLEAFVDESAMARALVARLRPLAAEGVSLALLPGMYGACLLAPWLSAAPWPDVVRVEGRGLRAAIMSVAERVARDCRMIVVPGTFPLWTAGGYRECAIVAGPDGILGEAVGTQPDADDVKRMPGDVLEPIDTPIGRVGLLIGTDVYVPEVSRILMLKGADVLLAPLHPPAPYSSEQALAGLWREVQQNQVFGLEAGLVGDLAGRLRAGKAALLAPCEISAEESGFLGRPGYLVREGSLVASLDFPALGRLRQAYPLRRMMNPALYRAHAQTAGGGAGLKVAIRRDGA